MIKYFPVRQIDYAASDLIQQTMSRKLLDLKKLNQPTRTPVPHAILGFEITPPAYTYGRRQRGNIPEGELDKLRTNCPQAQVIETMRGGHTTFHGPGQLVMYPVLDLQQLGIKVRDYVCILEKSIVHILNQNYAINAEQRPGAGLNGVWISNTNKKIASVGVHVRRNVTTHGLALNIDVDPFWFRQIVPCNLPDADIVSIADLVSGQHDLGKKISVSEVGRQLAQEIARRMGQQLVECT